MSKDLTRMWEIRDESYYSFLKHKYKDRAKLSQEAEDKRKAADAMVGSPHHLRMTVEADMASMRLDMAYIVDRNNQLEQYLETVEFLHQKVGILEGAYSHIKMLAEVCRNDYVDFAKKLKQLKES